jgi:hypothetical protein
MLKIDELLCYDDCQIIIFFFQNIRNIFGIKKFKLSIFNNLNK